MYPFWNIRPCSLVVWMAYFLMRCHQWACPCNIWDVPVFLLRDVCQTSRWLGHASPQPHFRQPPPLSCKITGWRSKYWDVVVSKLKCKWGDSMLFFPDFVSLQSPAAHLSTLSCAKAALRKTFIKYTDIELFEGSFSINMLQLIEHKRVMWADSHVLQDVFPLAN